MTKLLKAGWVLGCVWLLTFSQKLLLPDGSYGVTTSKSGIISACAGSGALGRGAACTNFGKYHVLDAAWWASAAALASLLSTACVWVYEVYHRRKPQAHLTPELKGSSSWATCCQKKEQKAALQKQQQEVQVVAKHRDPHSVCIPLINLAAAESGQNGAPVTQPCCTEPAQDANQVADLPSIDNKGIVDVWVLAGQSNCVGWNQADGQSMPAEAAPWEGRILSWNRTGGVWKTAVPNIHLGVYGYADADSVGVDMAFARTIIRTGTAHKVGLVPTACGGTNLYEQWAPGGELWSNMVNDTAAALNALGCQGRLAGIIWIQGESDAFNLVTASAYAHNFAGWLLATRSALQAFHPRVPLVMAVMATRQREQVFPFIDVVAQQQRDLKLPGVLQVEMAGYEFFDGGDGSLVHMTKAGCCAMGVAMAYEVAACACRAGQGRQGRHTNWQWM